MLRATGEKPCILSPVTCHLPSLRVPLLVNYNSPRFVACTAWSHARAVSAMYVSDGF